MRTTGSSSTMATVIGELVCFELSELTKMMLTCAASVFCPLQCYEPPVWMRVGVVPLTQDFQVIRLVEQGESFPTKSTKMDILATYIPQFVPIRSAGNPEGNLGSRRLPLFRRFDGRKHSKFERYGGKFGAAVVCCPYETPVREEIIRLLPPGGACRDVALLCVGS